MEGSRGREKKKRKTKRGNNLNGGEEVEKIKGREAR